MIDLSRSIEMVAFQRYPNIQWDVALDPNEDGWRIRGSITRGSGRNIRHHYAITVLDGIEATAAAYSDNDLIALIMREVGYVVARLCSEPPRPFRISKRSKKYLQLPSSAA